MRFVVVMLFAMTSWSVAFDALGSVRVVVSFSVLESLVKEVGGERVEVESLIPRGSDPHAYGLSPQDMVKLGDADVIIFNGLGFEGGLERALDALDFRGAWVEAGRGIDVEMLGDHDDHGDHGEGGVDPHGFHDPEAVKVYGRAIKDVLVEVDEEGSSYYEERYQDFVRRVEALDRELKEKFDGYEMGEGEVILVGHGGLGYFGRAYGFHFEGVEGLSGVSTLSGHRLREINEKIGEDEVRGIVYEYGRNDRLLRLLSEEMGVLIGGPFYVETLGEGGGTVTDWFSMMRHNAEVVLGVLM
jgi:zinc/manganese transport system substrate-binding protein